MTSPASQRFAFRVYAIASIAAFVLLLSNHLAVVAAYTHPMPGFVPTLIQRGQDPGQYLAWTKGFQDRWTVPDYFAPWATESGMALPLFWLTASIAKHFGLTPQEAYTFLKLAAYVLAGCGLMFLLQTFTDNARDAFLALVFAACSLPLGSFLLLPRTLVHATSGWLAWSNFDEFAGGHSADGFFQGVECSMSITIGTASVLISLSMVGRYFESRSDTRLLAAGLTVALGGFLHPFEFIAVLLATVITMMLKVRPLLMLIRRVAILAAPSFLVFAFYLLQLRHEWVRIASAANLYWILKLPVKSSLLGWPMLLALTLIPFSWTSMHSAKDRLLQFYVMTAFALAHSRLLWPQHFVDGLYYAGGVLLARQLSQAVWLNRLFLADGSRRSACLLALLAAYALAVHILFRYETYRGGISNIGQRAARESLDEVAVINWLRANARADQLALTPVGNAPYIATVPMHSFASHWLLSLTIQQQRRQSEQFFEATMTKADAHIFLRCYGIHWVVIPRGSGASKYFDQAVLRRREGGFSIFEIREAAMFPLPELLEVTPGEFESSCPG